MDYGTREYDVNNGRFTHGIAFARERNPQLIILDVRLPDGSGFDFCKQMRALGIRQPILMLTVQRDEIDKVLGLEMGADDYLTKPYSLRELLARVRALLRDGEGKSHGFIELSEGLAYGREAVDSVARGWLVASIIAVVLAAGVGWFISRRISAPVLALTNTTARMANGDLASRAAISSCDEFGTLAHSFNEMADQVEATVNALRRFASDAAHELNSPHCAPISILRSLTNGRAR